MLPRPLATIQYSWPSLRDWTSEEVRSVGGTGAAGLARKYLATGPSPWPASPWQAAQLVAYRSLACWCAAGVTWTGFERPCACEYVYGTRAPVTGTAPAAACGRSGSSRRWLGWECISG